MLVYRSRARDRPDACPEHVAGVGLCGEVYKESKGRMHIKERDQASGERRTVVGRRRSMEEDAVVLQKAPRFYEGGVRVQTCGGGQRHVREARDAIADVWWGSRGQRERSKTRCWCGEGG